MYFDTITLAFYDDEAPNRTYVTQEQYDAIQLQLLDENAKLVADKDGNPVVLTIKLDDAQTEADTVNTGDDLQNGLARPPMRYFYCSVNNGIYDSEITDTCVEITGERLNELIDARDAGGEWYADDDGYPQIRWPEPVEPVEPELPPGFTIEQEYMMAKSRLAFGRFVHEVSPLTLPTGVAIKMDRESQAQLLSAFITLKFGFIQDTPWKGMDGWDTLTIESVEHIVGVVANHVRSSFAREKILEERLDALYVDENIDAIRAFDWSVAD